MVPCRAQGLMGWCRRDAFQQRASGGVSPFIAIDLEPEENQVIWIKAVLEIVDCSKLGLG